ncbi:5-deoxy-glucuronate isomerase [Commensalibacter communis]|uniref:5-deoxy-glucuronate isomerase n=1 Tax=Commensalibacter communis TaxID=2972786 RepID=UPI0022FF52C4|nr:5-deoxy-glucuronate isomerase [Commensalibacter communis]CAI3956937.1 5-deoxy-D-glucuronate isomerase (IolB) (PDB:2QJV) [Commensalibacter communis]CAI3957705.1 5-deoxy-D-glucuronate isomerase (IolB) (PDB:2QJV) [Commensalibacter communis]
MSKLLVKPHAPDAEGIVTRITPQSAGWKYIGFEVAHLQAGQTLARDGNDNEVCLVIITGKADISTAEKSFGILGERMSVFDGKPSAVYVPPHMKWTVKATTHLEIAICQAPAKKGVAPYAIKAEDIETVKRGSGTNVRYVNNMLTDTDPSESLLVVEVITPGGNWSSYPPHKHDTPIEGKETYLEETYYHRNKRKGGYVFQRVYTDDRSLDETMSVYDGETVMVPKGYHPVGAPHGCDSYYLNVMAGPTKQWKFSQSPDFADIAFQ